MRMLTLTIINDETGTHKKANYKYYVFINSNMIEQGEVKGHDRDKGWKKLVEMILKNKGE